jgi:protoheme IX farnesyltransferase
MGQAVVGTALVAGGSAVLNQVYERDTDALMRRTRRRPLPDRRVTPTEALIYGLVLTIAGLAVLAFATNWVAATLALATLALYLFVYTPMKRTSNLSTLVGAVPGALPAVIGWSAARGDIAIGGLSLFAIVFLWQIPHFMALAWMFRDDYRSAGFPMLPVVEPDGLRTGQQALLYSAALLPVSIGPTVVGIAGWAYFWLALVLGVGLLVLAARFARERTDQSARTLFFASIIYLPIIWAVMVLDH